MKTMSKKQFAELLCKNGIDSVTVIRTPDWSGGHGYRIMLNRDPEDTLGDFEYVEFEGDRSKAVSKRNKRFFGYKEPLHEEPYETDCGSVLEMVLDAIS
jgi:hypothetical protein